MKPAARPSVNPTLLILAATLLPAGGAAGAVPDAVTPPAAAPRVMLDAGAANEAVSGFIVYYRDDAAPGEENAKAAVDTRKAVDQDLARVKAALSIEAKRDRRLATGGHLLSVPKALGKSAALGFMREMATNPQIDSIEPNVRHWPTAVPNDPHYSSQWGLREAVGGLNIEPAWDHTVGSGVVIAVIDTGRTAHPDLDAKTVPGYDFISNAAEARDGSGRDSDPSDMGTWNSAGECGAGEPAKDSSWHGTHVAGIAAALTHNGLGIAGAAPGAAIQHVRVLGRCGGTTADIAEGIIWASGGQVSGVPTNPTPARVLNLSLGGSGECGT
ncbi:MAG TPA: S8 family serine peptidase, partial [Chiayiivirga sp.]|nr:S8 family serine peptidase [Chiayiivirga sp.]